MASRNRVLTRRDGVKAFFKRLSIYNGYEVVVGVPEDARNRDGISLALIGTVHEFGSLNAGVPQRSFLRDTFDQNERKYVGLLKKGVTATIKRNVDPRQTLFKVGQRARADVVKRFNEGIPPPLAESTIDRKGSSLPLVDTGQLRASITAIVRREGGGAI